MNSRTCEIHMFLKEDAPLDFIMKTLTNNLPGSFSIKNPHKKEKTRLNKLLNPQLIFTFPVSNQENHPYLLAAELMAVHYGRQIKIGEDSFPFYRNTESYVVLSNEQGQQPTGNTLVFSRNGQRMLTEAENNYYFDFEHEERIEEELNKKYIYWDSISVRKAFHPFIVESLDKGRTEQYFNQYIAPLIPVFEKYDLNNNLNLVLHKTHNKIERI